MRDKLINDITTITIGNKEYTAIIIGADNQNAPKHLLQKERLDGVIVDKDELYAFPWLGITGDGIYQYVYFEKCELEMFETITTTNRANALNLVEELAFALLNVNRSFLNLESGFFPIYRIYILDKTKIVLLPPDCSDVLTLARIGARREKDLYNLIRRSTEKSYTLVLEMAEFLYWSATGVLPFENENVRTAGSNEIPLSWYEKNLPRPTEDFINDILDAGEKEQRANGGNRRPEENLEWFLENASTLDWNLKDITEEERNSRLDDLESKAEFVEYYTKVDKKARVRNFWRLKGTLIITLGAILAVCAILFGNFLSQALKAPATKDMNPTELITAIYDMQNNLDANHFNDAVKGELPQTSEVTNLFVNKQTRMAYEQIDPLVNAASWIDSGKPEILDTAFIYGVILESITQLDNTTWLAKATWYTPYAYDEKEDEYGEYQAPDGYTPLYVYEISQTFDIQMNKRGWYEVVKSEIISYTFKGRELVKTYKRSEVPLSLGLSFGL